MHDDQHGTAIICSAGIINALELTGKVIGEAKIVINGAKAAVVACAKLILLLGAKKENLVMLNSRGVLRADWHDLNKHKAEFSARLIN